MAIRKEAKEAKQSGSNVESRLTALEALMRKVLKKAEIHWGKDIDCDGKIGGAKLVVLVLLAVGMVAGVAFAVDSEAGDVWNVKVAAVRSNGDFDLDGGVNGSGPIGSTATSQTSVGAAMASSAGTYNLAATVVGTNTIAAPSYSGQPMTIIGNGSNVTFVSTGIQKFDGATNVAGAVVVGQDDVFVIVANGTNWVAQSFTAN